METCVMLLNQPLLIVHLAVCNAGEEHDHSSSLFGLCEGYIFLAAPLSLWGMGVIDIFVIERFSIKHDAVKAILGLHQRPEGNPSVINVRIVSRYNIEIGHGLAWYSLALALLPVLDAVKGRLRHLAWGIVHERCHHYILHRLREMLCRKFAEFLRNELECIPIALCLPVWRNSSAHRMDIRVEICGVYILLLIPVGSRKDYIR